MKGSIRKMLGRLRQRQAETAPKPTKRKRRRSKSAGTRSAKTRVDVTGQTVFHDRALRFRSLTVAEADIPTLERASAIEGAFKIRVAKRSGSRRDAQSLVLRKYTGRGFTIPTVAPQPRIFTFIAYDEGRVVGTVGLGADSEQGLSADELYRVEIDGLRAAGHRVCEFTRLAVDRNAASKSVLAGLFHTAYLYASRICRYTHAVIEVNPRHVTFYGRELKFEAIGSERLNRRVNAPAVLLCASFERIADELQRYAGKAPPAGAKRTLFYYGFSQEEELGVLNRLYALVLRNSLPANSIV